MKKQYLAAIALLIFLLAWMFVPRERAAIPDRYATPEDTRTVMAISDNATPGEQRGDELLVRVSRISAQQFTQQVAVRGVTQAFRHVDVLAETAGRIIATPAARGARVAEGDVLCEIAVENREADLLEARSRREQARLEYEGAVELRTRNLVSEVSVAQQKAALDSATAAVERAELALQRTKVRAPFAGLVERRTVEVGDYLNMGATCASLLDDTPMLLVGQVPERDINRLAAGNKVQGRLVTGEVVQGQLTFVARAADPVTRSYRIEVELEPASFPVRQGISTDVLVAAEQIEAHLIPPSSITLDDRGAVGIKTVDSNNQVQFFPVTIVGESTQIDAPGFWVTGLPAQVNVITLGQELVFAGQTVRTNESW